MFNLKNKTAIITGGNQGIGKGIAEVLAKAGANIVICSRSEKDCKNAADKLAKKYKVKALGLKCDVSDKDDVKGLIDSTVKKFRKVDILVNNAGIFFTKPFLEYTEDDWDKMISVDLKGVYLCSHAAAKVMARQKSGKIVNISSIAGIIGYHSAAAYCAAKGGVITLTKELALELAQYNINVNAIAPGAIDTPMTSFLKKDKKLLKKTLAGIPLKRMGKPSDIGNAALYLASEESSYVTGNVLVVDGGWTSQ